MIEIYIVLLKKGTSKETWKPVIWFSLLWKIPVLKWIMGSFLELWFIWCVNMSPLSLKLFLLFLFWTENGQKQRWSCYHRWIHRELPKSKQGVSRNFLICFEKNEKNCQDIFPEQNINSICLNLLHLHSQDKPTTLESQQFPYPQLYKI